MATTTEIANMALSHLGQGKQIANLATEKSNEAFACLTFFQVAQDATLRDFAWPFATKIVPLGLVANLTPPPPVIVQGVPYPVSQAQEWAFSYAYPADCLEFRRILSGLPSEHPQKRVAYKIFHGDSGRLIYTNQPNAQAEYTVKITDTERFTPDFILALSYRLAGYIAPRVTGGDPFKLGDKAMAMAKAEIDRAHTTAGNEEQPRELPDSEFIRARNDGWDSANHGDWRGNYNGT